MLLRNARLLTEPDIVDLLIEDGAVRQIGPDLVAPQGIETLDLDGRLVTAPLVEPHIHLDAVLTEGQPRPNQSGSLFEGIAVWGERTPSLTVEDVTQRAREVLRWQLACGVQHVRSHVDVCDHELRALRALTALRDELMGQIDLQLVAFPQQSVFGFDGGPALMREAMELGADVVGGIPHFELTREDGVASVQLAFDLAQEFDGPDRHPLRRDRRRPCAVRRGDGRRDDQAGDERPGHREPHDGDALLQRGVRQSVDHEHRASQAAHGDQPARQRRPAGPLRRRTGTPRHDPRQGAAGRRRQRRDRA